MHPRISLNTISSFTWPLADDLAMLRRLDAPHFGFPLLKIEDDLDAGVAAIRAEALPVSCVAASTATASLLTAEDALAVLAPAIDAAHELESPLCYFTSGTTPDGMPTDDAFSALADAVPGALAYAEGKGVRLAIENNSVTNRSLGFVHTLPDTVRLCEQTGLQVCLELQNCWYEADLPRLFRQHVAHIGIVQVSDFRVGEGLQLNRRALGDGSMPLGWMIGHLLDAGYEGLFDIEVIGPSIDEEGPESALRRSADRLTALLEELGA